MIKCFFFFISALVFLCGNTSFISASNGLPTHTQYTPIELKPAFLDSNNSYQTASVCFLGSGVGCGDGNFDKGDEPFVIDTAKQCQNEGFVNSCSTGYCMDYSCPYNGNYGKCLKENCPVNSSITCTGAIDGKNACGVDCRKCCVTFCPSGYTYSSIPNGYIQDGEACDHCTKGKQYKIKPNQCTGYSTCQYGPASGATSCLSGTVTKYSACRPCTESCPSGSYTYRTGSGGCGGASTMNECRTQTCYYPYEACPCYPYSDETNCRWGATYCSDGCGGNRICCSSAPGPDYRNCCDDVGAGCSSYSECRSRTRYDDCSVYYSECRGKGGNPRIQYCGDYQNQINPVGCPTTNYNCTRNVSWFICEYY